ncbi:MAG: beta-lactamase family protein [Desulfarculus sp.]|nr:beta-lactamase family protein [Desulfarculus sp.]
MPEWSRLAGLLDQGVNQGVAPAVALLAWRDGGPAFVHAAGAAQPDTWFDLASLTKPLATALMALDQNCLGRLPWKARLGDLLGRPVPVDKAAITIQQLLAHAAGYAPYQPFHQVLDSNPPAMRRGLLLAMLMNEPLAHAPGHQALYSDLGYMLLGLILERLAGVPLETLLARVYADLGVEGPRYFPLAQGSDMPLERIAPCGPLPGRPLIHGQVEDENAYSLGGVAGHAGLFGGALEVARVMDALCRAALGGGPWPAERARRLFELDRATPGSGRTPGFDTPSGAESQAGASAPPGTVGHLGFTGVSLWWHPASNRGLVLLTNRVALGRGNEKIKDFRRRVHQEAWPLLGF